MPTNASTAANRNAAPVYETRPTGHGEWFEAAHVGVLRDWMELAGFRHSELVAHIADLDAGHVLTADNGREFRRQPGRIAATTTAATYEVWARRANGEAAPYRTDLLRSVAVRWAALWNAAPPDKDGSAFAVVRVVTTTTYTEEA